MSLYNREQIPSYVLSVLSQVDEISSRGVRREFLRTTGESNKWRRMTASLY